VFEELKEKITSQPVLSLPRREGKFRVEMDTRIRTCYRGSTIPRIRWKMETDSISIKDNATIRKKL